MKLIIKIALIVLSLVMFSTTSFTDGYTFRKTKWGMSISEVKSSENLDISEEKDDMLVYKTKVIDKKVFVIYIFTDNKLAKARYLLAGSHTNNNDYITDYNDFKEILTKKYGSPRNEQTLWKNDLYKDNHSHWGLAISIGHLKYFSTWETDSTEIINALSGDNFNILCGVQYRSKNLKEIEIKAKEKKALKQF